MTKSQSYTILIFFPVNQTYTIWRFEKRNPRVPLNDSLTQKKFIFEFSVSDRLILFLHSDILSEIPLHTFYAFEWDEHAQKFWCELVLNWERYTSSKSRGAIEKRFSFLGTIPSSSKFVLIHFKYLQMSWKYTWHHFWSVEALIYTSSSSKEFSTHSLPPLTFFEISNSRLHPYTNRYSNFFKAF